MQILWLAAKVAYMSKGSVQGQHYVICIYACLPNGDCKQYALHVHGQVRERACTCMIPTARPVALILVALLPPNSPLGCATSNTPTTHEGTQIQMSLQLPRTKMFASPTGHQTHGLHNVSSCTSKSYKSPMANQYLGFATKK